jgi:hypothetical protein
MKKIKFTYNQVKTFIESVDGYTLLSTEYINNTSKLKISCSEHHVFEMARADFQQGHRCPTCTNCRKHTLDEVKEYVKNEGYIIISTKYKNAKTKLSVQCPKGHLFEMSYNGLQQGYRCPVCANNIKLTLDDVKKSAEEEGYTILSTSYERNNKNLRFQCPNGHQFNMRFDNFKHGKQRCPLCKCINNGSKVEKKVLNYVKSIYDGIIIENTRKIIKNYWTNQGLELDIYLPELNKAIEFNGVYWHNNDYRRWLDEMKKKQCIQKSIDLLVIREDNWYKDNNSCLKEIEFFINK